MPTDTEAGADMSAHGNGSDNSNAGAGDIDAKINRAITSHLGRFEKKLQQMLGGDLLAKAVEQHLEKMVESNPAPADDAAPANSGSDSQKLTLKTLQEQIANLNKGIEAERKARAEAEARTRDIRRTSSVESAFAKHLGADSPHLKPYVAHYLSQFEDRDGSVGRKVVGQYGDEQFVSLDDAVGELFKGELKHLIQQSKAAALPANSYARGFGAQPVAQQNAGQQAGRPNPLLMEIAQGLASERPEAAQIIAADAAKIQPPTPRK